MTHRIRRISVHQTALVVAIAQALLSLLFVPFFLFVTLFDPSANFFGIWMVFLWPIMALVFGYISTALWVFFYNLIASAVGGIEFELEPVSGPGAGAGADSMPAP